jgi:hypothetical protein
MRTIARRARRLSPQTALLLALLVVVGTLAVLSAPGNWLGRRLGVGAAPGHGLLVQRGAGAGGGSATGACGGSGAAPQATPLVRGVIVSEPATQYGTAELTKASDVVVLGTVTCLVKAQYIASNQTVWTTFTVRADAVLGGAQTHAKVAAGQQIEVLQWGGTADGHEISVQSDPLMTVGMQAYMFLRWGQPSAALTSAGYAFVGAPGQGRFTIVNGHVHQAAGMMPDTPDSDFRAAIARA